MITWKTDNNSEIITSKQTLLLGWFIQDEDDDFNSIYIERYMHTVPTEPYIQTNFYGIMLISHLETWTQLKQINPCKISTICFKCNHHCKNASHSCFHKLQCSVSVVGPGITNNFSFSNCIVNPLLSPGWGFFGNIDDYHPPINYLQQWRRWKSIRSVLLRNRKHLLICKWKIRPSRSSLQELHRQHLRWCTLWRHNPWIS